jgi:branched-chain amino acid transport system ATP-binding protein
MRVLLEVDDLCVNYGRIEAIRNVSFNVNEGEVVTLIGANGAGKTTTLKTVSGLRPVRLGSIRFQGRDITAMPAHERPVLGIAQSPEGRGCFVGMTVIENLDMGAYARPDRKSKKVNEDRDRVFGLFPRLAERRAQVAGTMSGGEQQMLAIGRALMANPKLLLLDEPSMGLAPMLIQQIFDIITEINKQGVTILLVEQNVFQSLRIAHRAYVLETGRVVLTGKGEELLGNEHVKKAYLGI